MCIKNMFVTKNEKSLTCPSYNSPQQLNISINFFLDHDFLKYLSRETSKSFLTPLFMLFTHIHPLMT